MSDENEEPMYYDYPVIGQVVCPVEDCDLVIDIHARMKVMQWRRSPDAPPLVQFDADVFPDSLSMHLMEHGTAARYYDSVEDYVTDEEDDDE